MMIASIWFPVFLCGNGNDMIEKVGPWTCDVGAKEYRWNRSHSYSLPRYIVRSHFPKFHPFFLSLNLPYKTNFISFAAMNHIHHQNINSVSPFFFFALCLYRVSSAIFRQYLKKKKKKVFDLCNVLWI